MSEALRVLAIGEHARIALESSAGRAAPLPGFADSPYLLAGGEVIWVGARLPAMHPRAVLTESAPLRGAALRLAPIPAHGWRAELPVRIDSGVLCRVLNALAVEETPRGFGTLLAGRAPEFPLDLGTPFVRALADAYARDDSDAVFDASVALLGFGTGLTPSGDDLAGAALFGRRLVARHDGRREALADALCGEAARRSHAVSAALFCDLACGCSFAPLHELADALAARDEIAALDAARTLAGIGHSSGWDMVAGLTIGACLRWVG